MRKTLLIILLVIIVVALGIVVYVYIGPSLSTENRQINAWIKANNLNKYGDPENTAYSNEKPCQTTLDCFDYIKKMHPEKPWLSY